MATSATNMNLQTAAEKAASGVRDVESMRNASERMDALRETVKRRCGLINLAVDLVREARDQ